MIKRTSLFLAILLFSNVAQALNPSDLYDYAKKRDYFSLSKLKGKIETMDNNGDTAVCLAVKNNDVSAYNLLVGYGANSRPKCYQNALKYRKAVMNGKPVPSSVGSGTFLGMGTTGWAVTGGLLAAGGVAAAAGGGGGGGDSSGSTDDVAPPITLNCINGQQINNSCICEEGWTGSNCEYAKQCSPLYKISCNEKEYETGNMCPSGWDTLKECKAHIAIEHCTEYSPTKANTCVSCENGYNGDKCSPINCAAYGYSLDCGQGYDEAQACLSGEIPYYTCTAKIPPANYKDTPCDSGYDEIDQGWYGDKKYYLCKPVDVPSGYTPTPCDTTNGYEQVGTSILSAGTTYYKCEPRDCSGYKSECAATEYDTGMTCNSAGTFYKQCQTHTFRDNCTAYSPTSDTCTSCKEGWEGTTCETPATCSLYDTKVKQGETCPDGYSISVAQTCKSGNTTYVYCKPNDCTGYEYSPCDVKTKYMIDKCIHPTYSTMYKCVTRSANHCVTFNTSEDKCNSCQAGYTGTLCNEAADGYIIGSDGNSYTKLECQNGGTQVNDKCSCPEDYEGNLCETEKCIGYVTECTTGQWKDTTDTCTKDGTPLYMCKDYTVVNKCSEYNPTANACEKCFDGYELSGSQCVAKTPETGYQKETCDEGYDLADTKKFGEDTYYKCTPKDCSAYQSTCGSGYNAIEACLSGTTTYYSCEPKQCPSDTQTTMCDTSQNLVSVPTSNYSGENVCYKCVSCSEYDNCTYDSTTDTFNLIGTIAETNNEIIEIKNAQGLNLNVYGMKGYTYAFNAKNNNGIININKSNGTGNIYGISAQNAVNTNTSGQGMINITNNSDSNVYGLYGIQVYNYTNNGTSGSNDKAIITINNNGDGNVYGMYSTGGGAYLTNGVPVESSITINNSGTGITYGIYSESSANINYGTINIKNTISDHDKIIYGVKATSDIYGTNNSSMNIISNANEIYGLYTPYIYNASSHVLTLVNFGSQNNVVGIYLDMASVKKSLRLDQNSNIDIRNLENGKVVGIIENTSTIVLDGNISITKDEYKDWENETWQTSSFYNQTGEAIGIENNGNNITNNGIITIDNTEKGIGIYAKGGTIDNTNTITITNAEYGIGIYVNAGTTTTTVTNHGGSLIDVSGTNAYGIYVDSSSKDVTISNEGEININGTNAYGIYVEEGASATIDNIGSITINGTASQQTCSNCIIDGNYIVLNGATLFNDGVMQASSMNLNNMGGTVLATENSSFEIEDEFSGDLTMSSDIVTTGFDDVYTTTNTINAGDTSNLNLLSQSALFDASLAENNSDVNLKMKQFNEVVDNKSLADFLQNNYAMKNNETFFNTLKKQETVASLNDTLSDLTGQKLFSRFADEDLMMMRELTFDMNNRLFMNDEDHLETSGNISTFNFNGNSGSNSRYALINQDYGSYKLGLNYGFADVRSYDNNDDNRREEMMFHMGMPISYHKKGFKFITTPHIGYASGTYDRKGLNSENYDGHIEKTMFGLMNEARYPIVFDKWTIAPSVEFNVVNYTTKGHEKGGTNPLNLDLQHNYSVEAGLGLYANTQHKFGLNSKLSFTGGIAVYHEFADPYKLSIGMEGMNGKFDIRDENRSDNRAVIRTGLKFANDNMSLGANVMSYIDREYRTNATLDFKYNF